jgi:hypothetical protein
MVKYMSPDRKLMMVTEQRRMNKELKVLQCYTAP